MFTTFKSKRVWTVIVMFLVNGVGGVSEFISPGVLNILNPVLLALGVIFGLPGMKSK